MRALGRCGDLYRPQSLAFRGILHRTLHANRRLGPALSGPAPSGGSIEVPYTPSIQRIQRIPRIPRIPRIVYQNGNTVATVTTAHQRYFSTTGHSQKKARIIQRQKNVRLYKWATKSVPEDLYEALESHILSSSRRVIERFPVAPEDLDPDPDPKAKKGVPETLDPHNPDHEAPPDLMDPMDLEDFDDPDKPPPKKKKTYAAVVIDCEMVAMRGGEQGLLKIAVIDFFSGYIILRSLVRPEHAVTDWRREVTGFKKEMLREAIKKGKVLSGWPKVRDMIFDVTTRDTIFVGHALANDLRVLRIATDRVVDSMLLMSIARYGDTKAFPRNWGLKSACKELLNIEVQKTKGPHNPLEDAFASRELVIHALQNPEKLEAWAKRTRQNEAQVIEKERAIEKAKAEKKLIREAKKAKAKAEKAAMTPEERAERAAERERLAEEKRKAKAAKKAEEQLRLRLRKAETRRRKAERLEATKERKRRAEEQKRFEAEQRSAEEQKRFAEEQSSLEGEQSSLEGEQSNLEGEQNSSKGEGIDISDK
ncbi:ribonuclease H-like domain-containing protein [Xylaria cf. heliscus]|nr:ribonuclease H-like domain-containing protein [Xylaria cf. heliscus]